MDINERREALSELLDDFAGPNLKAKLLLELHDLGLVFKVEGELPSVKGLDKQKAYTVIAAQGQMLKAGYTLTAPIKEGE